MDYAANPGLDKLVADSGVPRDEAIARLRSAELAAGRECGPCRLCCRLVGVPELDKPPRRDCVHLAGHGGCAIHATRPDGCRVYACAWKQGFGGDESRPDRLGGILEWHTIDREAHPYGGYWLFRMRDRHPTTRARKVLDRLREIGCLVLLYHGPGEDLVMLYPDGAKSVAGMAPLWEVGSDAPMEWQLVPYRHYRGRLPQALQRLIEAGVPPFLEGGPDA